MIFCLIFIVIAVIFLIGQYITSKYEYQAAYYTKQDFEQVKDPKTLKSMKRKLRLYKLTKFTESVFGDVDSDDARFWIVWITIITFSIILMVGICTDASEVTRKNAEYDSYKIQLENGYIWATQESIASEQRYIAELKAYVHEHPIRTFYKVKDVDALYDKVMSFEIPDVENTYKFKTATRFIVDEREIKRILGY